MSPLRRFRLLRLFDISSVMLSVDSCLGNSGFSAVVSSQQPEQHADWQALRSTEWDMAQIDHIQHHGVEQPVPLGLKGMAAAEWSPY